MASDYDTEESMTDLENFGHSKNDDGESEENERDSEEIGLSDIRHWCKIMTNDQ